jgi:hypothetical protein
LEGTVPSSRHLGGTNTTEIINLEIVGWWSECAAAPSASTGLCAGTFQALTTPILLDPTGNTCYVNPVANYPAVQWLGGVPNANGTLFTSSTSEVVFYTLILTTEKLMEQFFPQNCPTGACRCDSIEPLRKGWNSTPNGNLSSWCQYNTLCSYDSIVPDVGNCTIWTKRVAYDYENGTNLKLCAPLAEIQPKGFTTSAAARTTAAVLITTLIISGISVFSTI